MAAKKKKKVIESEVAEVPVVVEPAASEPVRVTVRVQVAHESYRRGDEFDIELDSEIEKNLASGLLVRVEG